jgi:hypothetical protein
VSLSRWPPIKTTWESIRRALEKEFNLKDYKGFPARKLAVMDYLLAQMLAVRAEIQAEFAVKVEGRPEYKY